MKRLKLVALFICAIITWQIALGFSLKSQSSLVYVIVHSNIYNSIKPQLDQYAADLQNEGLNAYVYEYAGGAAEDIRSLLQYAYPQGLVGCLIVGDVPSAWYEMDVSYPLQPQITHQEFPTDLFYMDLDGVWKDIDKDGKYDEHTGDRAPEIWIGRLEASRMAESEVSLIQNYFFKNHAYRNGILKLPERALIYVDDFWADIASDYSSAVGLVFANRTIVNDKVNTNPKDYLHRLKEDWALVHLFVHGTPTSHHFYVNNAGDEGCVYSSDVRQTDPHAFFYVLISCWNARYTERDYIGGWYIFSRSYGLVAISSTKPGDMQKFRGFYTACRDRDIGTAFREWFSSRIKDEDTGDEYTKKYFYGITILGDPTLHLKPSYYPEKAFYAAISTSGLPSTYSTRVYVDGIHVESIQGGESKKIILLKGSPHNVSVDPLISGGEGVRYMCPFTSIMFASTGSCTFHYAKQYYMSVSSPYGNVTGSGWYDANTMVTFSVAPSMIARDESSYFFESWSGDSTATTTTATIVMDAPKRVVAIWKKAAQVQPIPSETNWSYVAGVIIFVVTSLIAAILLARKLRRRK